MPTSITRTSSADIALLVLAIAVFVCGVDLASAQEVPIAPPDSATGKITGFAGLVWGSDRATVEDRWGPPDTVREVPSLRAQALIYADRSILEEEGAMGFLVHPDSGLVRGLYLMPYGRREDCRRLYTKFRDSVTRALGGLEGDETRVNRAEDLDFCTAFQLGRAMAQTVWQDTARGGRVWLRLDRSVGALRVSYESLAFRELWERSRQRSAERWLGGETGAVIADTSSMLTDSLQAATDTTAMVGPEATP